MIDTDWYLRYGRRPSRRHRGSRPLTPAVTYVGSAPHADPARGQAPRCGPFAAIRAEGVDEPPHDLHQASFAASTEHSSSLPPLHRAIPPWSTSHRPRPHRHPADRRPP